MVIDFIEFILSNNIFHFNNSHFRQIKGTAMGSKFAPTYATLVIGYLERQLYSRIEQHMEKEVAEYIKENFWRFLDDCFMIWIMGQDNLMQFYSILNSLDEDIHYVIEFSTDSTPFLDVLIVKKDDQLITDIYYKVTDSKQYLPFNSCHPKHIKVNIPYNLSKRICTIVSDQFTREKRLSELSSFLEDLNYPKAIIQQGIKKATEIERNTPLKSTTKKDKSNLVPFISYNNPLDNEIFKYIKSNFNILTSDPRMKNVLQNQRVINCKRQPPNLKSILTKSIYCRATQNPSVKKCGRPRCTICSIILTGEKFVFQNGKFITIKFDMDCSALNCIYVIRCSSCDLEYIGETNNFRARTALHRSQINNPSYGFLKVSIHIRNCSDCSFKIMPIFKLITDCPIKRKMKEEELIKRFQPALNCN